MIFFSQIYPRKLVSSDFNSITHFSSMLFSRDVDRYLSLLEFEKVLHADLNQMLKINVGNFES